MKTRLLIGNHVLQLPGASLYLGTGGARILSSLPIVSGLTPANDWLQFLSQRTRHDDDQAMLACTAIMLVAESRQSQRWVPMVVLVAIIAAKALTIYRIFPPNNHMASDIEVFERLRVMLREWILLDRIRVAPWCMQWAALACYCARWTLRARFPVGAS